MVSSWMLRRVALVRTDVSEEPSASFIRVTRIGELEQHKLQLATDARCEEIPLGISSHPDEGGARFLRNVGSYNSHTV
jgi:hypothetical protein